MEACAPTHYRRITLVSTKKTDEKRISQIAWSDKKDQQERHKKDIGKTYFAGAIQTASKK